MMEDWATGYVIGSLHGRRELDMANGVLVALRRCGPDAAFRELLGAAKRHGVGVMAMASAVVDLAVATTSPRRICWAGPFGSLPRVGRSLRRRRSLRAT
jgi:hypothetical protein